MGEDALDYATSIRAHILIVSTPVPDAEMCVALVSDPTESIQLSYFDASHRASYVNMTALRGQLAEQAAAWSLTTTAS